MSDQTERLIGIIEKLVDENAELRKELSKQWLHSPVVTMPTISYRSNDLIKPPYTVSYTCGAE